MADSAPRNPVTVEVLPALSTPIDLSKWMDRYIELVMELEGITTDPRCLQRVSNYSRSGSGRG